MKNNQQLPIGATIRKTGKIYYRLKLVYKYEYSSWCSMLQRCTNPKRPNYKDYGGRGITVCDRWKCTNGNDGLGNFIKDMGTKPSRAYSLDRIDNNGNYEPGNCKWSTRTEQNNNSRHVKLITYNGETHTMSQWAKIINLNYDVVKARILKGWSVEKTFTTPLIDPYKKKER